MVLNTSHTCGGAKRFLGRCGSGGVKVIDMSMLPPTLAVTSANGYYHHHATASSQGLIFSTFALRLLVQVPWVAIVHNLNSVIGYVGAPQHHNETLITKCASQESSHQGNDRAEHGSCLYGMKYGPQHTNDWVCARVLFFMTLLAKCLSAQGEAVVAAHAFYTPIFSSTRAYCVSAQYDG